MSYKDQALSLYQMIGEGKLLEAFEKFYHEDVVMIEADGNTREGKDANREYEKQFLGNVQEVHDGGVHAVTSDEENGITMVESWMEVTFKDGNRIKMEEVAVQHWKSDQIIKERFYYNMG